jgi:hypothetical protein
MIIISNQTQVVILEEEAELFMDYINEESNSKLNPKKLP